MTRKIWATLEAMPFSTQTLESAMEAGASEIVQLPYSALPQVVAGFNLISDTVVVPQEVTMRQARLALLHAGLLDTVNTAVMGMTGLAGEVARIEWEYSKSVERYKELVKALTAQFGWTEEEVDALFIAASKYD